MRPPTLRVLKSLNFAPSDQPVFDDPEQRAADNLLVPLGAVAGCQTKRSFNRTRINAFRQRFIAIASKSNSRQVKHRLNP